MTIRMPHNVLAGDVITSVGPTAPPSPIVGTAWLNTAAASPATNILYGPSGEILLHTVGAGGVGRFTRLAGPQEDVHLRSGDAAGSIGFLEGQAAASSSANAYYDGANWQRYDTGQPVTIVQTVQSGLQLLSALAGANPIGGWTSTLIPAASFPALLLALTPPKCRAYNSATLSIPANTVTQLTFNSELYDTHGFHDGVTNTGRLTVPAGLGGTYLCGLTAQFNLTAGGNRRILGLRVNSATTFAIIEQQAPSGGGAYPGGTPVGLAQLNAGDWIDAYAYQDTAGALTIVQFANYTPELWLVRLGA